MLVFSIKNGILLYCKPHLFEFEKQMQTLLENNLGSFSELELIESESWIKDFRMDTLAFNRRLNCFAIIEYKRDVNYSVIDQGIAYLKLLNQNKAEFILKYNDKFKDMKIRSKDDINWRRSYVIFAAPEFTEHQKNAACWKDLKIILWLVKLYGNSILTISELSRITPPEKPAAHLDTGKSEDCWSAEQLWSEIRKISVRK